jgi:general secretion pathway protein J
VTPRPGRCAAAAGFTLVEVLVAMVVLGLLLGLLTTGLRLARQMSEAASVRLDAVGDVAMAQDFLARRLAAALPLPAAAERSDLDFTGTTEALSFVAALPEQHGGELWRFAIGIDAGAPDRPLVVLAAPLAEPGRTPERFVLVRQVSALRIAYLGSPDLQGQEPPAWQERWEERTTLPLLVRIDALIAEPAGTRWPTLIAHPLIAYVPE